AGRLRYRCPIADATGPDEPRAPVPAPHGVNALTWAGLPSDDAPRLALWSIAERDFATVAVDSGRHGSRSRSASPTQRACISGGCDDFGAPDETKHRASTAYGPFEGGDPGGEPNRVSL